MKTINNTKIIGIDHGYGNMKTANYCFKTGIVAYDFEPLFTKDMLVYDSRYYLIGEGHKAYAAEKMLDEEYYVLTLAAIAMELHKENITDATVHIAAGLPLTWVMC
jgi:plasmid segregation protein ParM